MAYYQFSRSFLWLLILALLLFSQGRANATPEKITVKDLQGKAYNLLDKSHKGAVLIFVLHDCPIANAFAPELRRVRNVFRSRGFTFYTVYADPSTTVQQAEHHAKEFGHIDTVRLLDRGHTLAKRFGATVTPEAIVVTPDGRIAYRGRIDDSYVDFGKRRAQPTRRDLRLALDAVSKDRQVELPRTKALGCFIPDVN